MDQDSDFIYTTNQKDIVEHARVCYEKYPTIVNNIPKDKNVYTSSLDDFARVDNLLSASQTDIGESSNLAQIAQSYSYTLNDGRFDDYCAILATLAQVCIDSSKRSFDIDGAAEIKYIKKQMDVKTNKYPQFWSVIRPGFNSKNISKTIHCPMNYLYDLRFKKTRSELSTIPISEFFIKHRLDASKRMCRNVEELIQKYSLEVREEKSGEGEIDYLILRSDYDQLINDLRQVTFSKNTVGVMSWLIDRAFVITPAMRSNKSTSESNLNKNRALLLKILYDTNKAALFSCFKKDLDV